MLYIGKTQFVVYRLRTCSRLGERKWCFGNGIECAVILLPANLGAGVRKSATQDLRRLALHGLSTGFEHH